MSPDDILANADRLISDARFMHDAGRSRSAATLIAVALEQMGSFVEELTQDKYPDAVVHMGIFGEKVNAHSGRQDALAAHVMNVAMGDLTNQFLWEIFLDKTRGCGDAHKFLQWLQKCVPIEFREEQKQRMKDSPEMKAASFLMHLVRQDDLKKLREYGLYENSRFRFSPESVHARKSDIGFAIEDRLEGLFKASGIHGALVLGDAGCSAARLFRHYTLLSRHAGEEGFFVIARCHPKAERQFTTPYYSPSPPRRPHTPRCRAAGISPTSAPSPAPCR
jgi:hypothetical protein